MIIDDYDGQMTFGNLEGLNLSDIFLTGEEKPRKNLTQETCPDQGSNPGPLRDRHACYHLQYMHTRARISCEHGYPVCTFTSISHVGYM